MNNRFLRCEFKRELANYHHQVATSTSRSRCLAATTEKYVQCRACALGPVNPLRQRVSRVHLVLPQYMVDNKEHGDAGRFVLKPFASYG